MKTRKNFKTVSSKIEFSNSYMTVYKNDVMRPDGQVKPYWILERHGDFSIIIPLFSDMTTILVGQYRLPARYYSWEFPMGFVSNVQPLEMAKQELLEETGYKALKWEKVGYFYLANAWYTGGAHVYVAKDLIEGKPQPEEGEFLRTKKVSISDVRKMINQGKIKDGPTISAYYFLHNYLNTEI